MEAVFASDTHVMNQVAKCESGWRQFNKEGSVLRGKVNNKDVGYFQINETYHLDTSIRLGYDIYTLIGNILYAKYLLDTYGLKPWKASESCWNPSSSP